MSTNVHSQLSRESYNRISSWLEALQKAYSNIKVKEHIENNMESTNNDCRFNLASKSHYTNSSYTASDALINYAIILVRHIFTTGDEGYGVARNRGNSEVDTFRSNMIDYVKNKTNWSDEEYQAFNALIRDNRNHLVAHYSGEAADFKELAPGIASKKMIGANIGRNDIEKLKIFIEAMCEHIENNLYAS